MLFECSLVLAPGLGLHYWTGGGGRILFDTLELQASFPNLHYKKNLLAMFGHHLSSEETMQGWEREGITQRRAQSAAGAHHWRPARHHSADRGATMPKHCERTVW